MLEGQAREGEATVARVLDRNMESLDEWEALSKR